MEEVVLARSALRANGLQESAELAADDRAVQLTGDALGLARALTHVASWANAALVPALAMARAGSPIVQRVARLAKPRCWLEREVRVANAVVRAGRAGGEQCV